MKGRWDRPTHRSRLHHGTGAQRQSRAPDPPSPRSRLPCRRCRMERHRPLANQALEALNGRGPLPTPCAGMTVYLWFAGQVSASGGHRRGQDGDGRRPCRAIGRASGWRRVYPFDNARTDAADGYAFWGTTLQPRRSSRASSSWLPFRRPHPLTPHPAQCVRAGRWHGLTGC